MTKVRVIAEARREFLDTVAWYEAQCPTLGVEFSAATARALCQIGERPTSRTAPLGSPDSCQIAGHSLGT